MQPHALGSLDARGSGRMPVVGGEPEAGIVQQVALRTRWSLHLGGREAGGEPEVGLLVHFCVTRNRANVFMNQTFCFGLNKI